MSKPPANKTEKSSGEESDSDPKSKQRGNAGHWAKPKMDARLNKVKLSRNRLTVNVTKKRTTAKQMITNPTETVVAFKVKTTDVDHIHVKPACGYVEPKGNMQLEITVSPSAGNAKVPGNERITTMLSFAPRDRPNDASDLWKTRAVVVGARRHALMVTFKRKKVPVKKAGKKEDKTGASLGEESEEESLEGEADDGDESDQSDESSE